MFDADKPTEPEREVIPDADLNTLAQSDSLRLYLASLISPNALSKEIEMLATTSLRPTYAW